MEEVMNRQAEIQKQWNEQIQKAIEDRFSKLEQVSIMTTEAGPSNRANPEKERNEQATPATICSQSKMRNELPQGNYPSTPILNSMIIDSVPAETSIGI
ncbi:1250_t:CDS:2 [Gigaspora margarita]|uniref:1250_t:CDS:1 n=1 Tax=Gigaspora margarita TaxID=4874 RepID=A0ABN7UZX5_GIGMA|nr:1250_t:CDS:2 [Gigaspora margarita]